MTYVPQSPGWAPRVSRKNHREEKDFRIQGSLEALPVRGCPTSSAVFLIYKMGMPSWGLVCSFRRCSACLISFLSHLPGSRCGYVWVWMRRGRCWSTLSILICSLPDAVTSGILRRLAEGLAPLHSGLQAPK